MAKLSKGKRAAKDGTIAAIQVGSTGSTFCVQEAAARSDRDARWWHLYFHSVASCAASAIQSFEAIQNQLSAAREAADPPTPASRRGAAQHSSKGLRGCCNPKCVERGLPLRIAPEGRITDLGVQKVRVLPASPRKDCEVDAIHVAPTGRMTTPRMTRPRMLQPSTRQVRKIARLLQSIMRGKSPPVVMRNRICMDTIQYAWKEVNLCQCTRSPEIARNGLTVLTDCSALLRQS